MLPLRIWAGGWFNTFMAVVLLESQFLCVTCHPTWSHVKVGHMTCQWATCHIPQVRHSLLVSHAPFKIF